MRTILIILAAMLAPFALWTIGCRQGERASVFPKGPEMKNLARAPGAARRDLQGPPVIPAAIDPEIVSTPDQPTFARIRAVMDREAVLAANHAEPGLFILPRQDVHELAAVAERTRPTPSALDYSVTIERPVYETELAPAPVMAQAPTRPQFWSGQAEPVPGLGFGLAPAASGISAMAPANRPVALPPPPPPAMPARMAPPEPIYSLESIPGVFSGTGEVGNSLGAGPFSSVGPPGTADSEQAFLPTLSAGSALGENRQRPFEAPAAPGAHPPLANPDTLGVAPVDSIPLASPAGGNMTAPTPKVAALLAKSSLHEALAPLTPLGPASAAGNAASMPLSPPSDPEPAARRTPKTAESFPSLKPLPLLDEGMVNEFVPVPLAPPTTDETGPAANRELFMTDFWEKRPPVLSNPDADAPAGTAPETRAGTSMLAFDPAVLEERRPEANADAPRVESAPAAAAPAPLPDAAGTADKREAPAKVVLAPTPEKKRTAPPDLKRIDGMMESPPLRY